MIEAESEEAMRRHADAIAAAIRNELGVLISGPRVRRSRTST